MQKYIKLFQPPNISAIIFDTKWKNIKKNKNAPLNNRQDHTKAIHPRPEPDRKQTSSDHKNYHTAVDSNTTLEDKKIEQAKSLLNHHIAQPIIIQQLS